MIFKHLGVLLASAALCAAVATSAGAAEKKKTTTGKVTQTSPVNYSYQSGPRTRVYVTKRSWLDPGTEVLPGDRKFNDYATGGPYQHQAIDRLNSHLDWRRQPLSETPWDTGGTPRGFPLY